MSRRLDDADLAVAISLLSMAISICSIAFDFSKGHQKRCAHGAEYTLSTFGDHGKWTCRE